MKQFYMVMGECDFVGIWEAPDDAVMPRYASPPGAPLAIARRPCGLEPLAEVWGAVSFLTQTHTAKPATQGPASHRTLQTRSSGAWGGRLQRDGLKQAGLGARSTAWIATDGEGLGLRAQGDRHTERRATWPGNEPTSNAECSIATTVDGIDPRFV